MNFYVWHNGLAEKTYQGGEEEGGVGVHQPSLHSLEYTSGSIGHGLCAMQFIVLFLYYTQYILSDAKQKFSVQSQFENLIPEN